MAENPAFDGHMAYQPIQYFTDTEYTTRIYGEMNTGDAWHYYQSIINPEETVNPVILASDATHLTNFSGDGKVHPTYISSGQIHGDIRAELGRRAFLLLCYIPVCKFNKTEFPKDTQQKNIAGRLQARLFHICMRIVLTSLKKASYTAIPIVDYRGNM